MTEAKGVQEEQRSEARQDKKPGSDDQKKADTQADQAHVERLTKWIEAYTAASSNIQEEWELDWNAQLVKDDAILATRAEVVDCTNKACTRRAKRVMMMVHNVRCW